MSGSQIYCSLFCCSFLFCTIEISPLLPLTLRSILAKPRALEARSLASWNSSFSDRLVSITDPLSQNSLPLFCRPASRNSPVDLSNIPAMSLPRTEQSPDEYELLINSLVKVLCHFGIQVGGITVRGMK
uniref:Uncharacterized protein n=1 Tax=Echeneis naucrates TaxID=173247 RepID=A0A665X7L9_ECHNA